MPPTSSASAPGSDPGGGAVARFTPCQVRLLEFLDHVPRARIAGVAGSGKTLMALEHARRCAGSGKRTLLLSGGSAPAARLRERLGAVAGVRVDSFHGLCRAVTRAAGGEFAEPAEPSARREFREWGASELLLEHLDAAELRWDAIVVDGGQDFFCDWWDALTACLAPGASFHAFYDEAQDVYGTRGIGALEALPGFELRLSCRSPGAVPEIVTTLPESGSRRAAIEALAADWTRVHGLSPERVAILSPYRRERTCLADVTALAGVPLTECVRCWRAGEGMLVSTIRAFRDLEADAIALIDLPRPGSHRRFGRADLHVGRSRPRRLLHLFAAEPGVVAGG